MQGARVLARALAAASRQRIPISTTKLGARQGEFAEIFDGLGFRAQQWQRPACRGIMGAAGVYSLSSSSLFPKLWLLRSQLCFRHNSCCRNPLPSRYCSLNPRSIFLTVSLRRSTKTGIRQTWPFTESARGASSTAAARVITRGCRMSTMSLGAESVKGLSSLVKGGVANQKRVGTWLFGCTGWVFSMVVLGGVTRLTRSGLSMTDWKFVGSLPPLTEEQWQMEFLKYQSSPEYRRVNRGMSLTDFKFIFWMEYAHRMWGRALGIVFAGPFAYFVLRGYISQRLGLRLSALMTMGAAQGFVGWWMVKSGLEEPETEYLQPRVSPYRLAAHLTSAFAIYSGLFWTALSVVSPHPTTIVGEAGRAAMKVRRFAVPVAAIVGVTAISGAFVAGNDAGHAYNTFPKMGDHWVPEGLMDMKPFFRNFFENTATVQLDHRILATTTLTIIAATWVATRKLPVDPRIRTLLNATFGMAALQVTLGISTLLMYVPVSLGAAHQAGALTLFSIVLSLVHAVRRPLPGSMAAAQIFRATKVSV